MPLYDYACLKCGWKGELFAEPDQKEIDCQCGGVIRRVWVKFGGVLGKNKGLYPYFDRQLGVTVESSQHRDRVAKSRGLEVMGKEEFDRSRNNHHTNHPWDRGDEPTPEFIEQAKRDWDDVVFKRAPQIEQKAIADAEADVLNVVTQKAEPVGAETGVSSNK